jgi:hypothetical protein
MKILAASFSSLALFGALFGIGGHLSQTDVEHAIGAQMNGGSAGKITRAVHCDPRSPAGPAGPKTYLCTLTGVNGSQEHAVVVSSGGTWQAAWAPLKG